MGSIRAADHPTYAGPNGITAPQICQIARYAGLSDRMLALGLFEHNPDLDGEAEVQLAHRLFGTCLTASSISLEIIPSVVQMNTLDMLLIYRAMIMKLHSINHRDQTAGGWTFQSPRRRKITRTITT